MGLLDDAIREHLELKRRRGADAGEISREETDALGPVRRSPEGVPELAESPAAAATSVDDPAAGYDAPAVPSEEEQTTVHTPPPVSSYEPPPVPPAPSPPAVEAYEPPPVTPAPAYEPPPPEPEPDFDPFPELDSEPPVHTPEVEERVSLLARFKRSRREAAEERDDAPRVAHESVPAEPQPAAYEPPQPPSSAPEPARYTPPAQREPDIVPADEEPDREDLLEETPDFLEETPEHDRLWFEQRPPRDFDFDG
jgi:hypothetical protein